MTKRLTLVIDGEPYFLDVSDDLIDRAVQESFETGGGVPQGFEAITTAENIEGMGSDTWDEAKEEYSDDEDEDESGAEESGDTEVSAE